MNFTASEEEEFTFRHRYEQEQKAKGGTGILPETLKGMGRGALDYVREVGNKLAPGTAVPEHMRPAVPQELAGLNKMVDQAIEPGVGATNAQQNFGKAGEFLGGALIGGMPKTASNVATAIPRHALNAELQTAHDLAQAGLNLSPRQMGAGATARAMEGLGGNKLQESLRYKNSDILKDWASEATQGAVPAARITAQSLDDASREISARAYQPLRDLGEIHLGTPAIAAPARKVSAAIRDNSGKIYTAEKGSTHLHVLSQNDIPAAAGREAGFVDSSGKWLSREAAERITGTGDAATYNSQLRGGGYAGSPFQQQLDSIAAKYKHVKGYDDVARNIESLRTRQLPADQALNRNQQIRNEASAAFREGNRDAGKALREINEALETQFERVLGHNAAPDVVEAYRAGRRQIARNHSVKDMLVDKSTGVIDATKAQRLLEDDVPLDGPLLRIAQAGSPRFASSTKPAKGKPPIIDSTDIWMGGLAGAGASMFSGPAGFAAAAIPSALRNSGRLPATNMMQRSMLGRLNGQPGTMGMSPEFLQRMITGGTGLFSDGER